jgi:hypothetical protein
MLADNLNGLSRLSAEKVPATVPLLVKQSSENTMDFGPFRERIFF